MQTDSTNKQILYLRDTKMRRLQQYFGYLNMISYDLHLHYFGYLNMNHIMRSYDLHLHNFPETFKGHKMGRLQHYFGYLNMISNDLHLQYFEYLNMRSYDLYLTIFLNFQGTQNEKTAAIFRVSRLWPPVPFILCLPP